MQSRERRTCRRYTLNHPVVMGTGEDGEHLAEILDAGTKGMRVRMTNQSGFEVGNEIDISCLSRRHQDDTLKLHCRVAWEDSENLEVGLIYLQ